MIFFSILSPKSHGLDNYSFIKRLEARQGKFSKLVHVFQDCFRKSWSFAFPNPFKIIQSISRACRAWIEIALISIRGYYLFLCFVFSCFCFGRINQNIEASYFNKLINILFILLQYCNFILFYYFFFHRKFFISEIVHCIKGRNAHVKNHMKGTSSINYRKNILGSILFNSHK